MPVDVGDPVDDLAMPPSEECQRQVQRILQSVTFRNAATLQQLLQFLTARALDRGHVPLKEYIIGIEAFGRSQDFDPKTDTIVRVQIHRLRQKLREYYDSGGRHDPILVDIPKGHYLPRFELAGAVTKESEEPAKGSRETSPARVHPLHGLRPGSDPDLFFNGRRNAKLRMDEVVGALRWQRIAAPFACGIGTFEADAEILNDNWKFAAGETWQHDIVGTTVGQGAPAVIARNIDLPVVKAQGEMPFVFTARFPNGAVAVGAQERTRPGHAWYMPPSEATVNAGDAPGPFGIFGEYERLTLTCAKSPQAKRVLAQDLAGDVPVDITARVEFDGNCIHFSGSLLRDVGLRDRTPGDLSSPGVVVALA
jgi:hypothetical protein